jgi:hypothetical protein
MPIVTLSLRSPRGKSVTDHIQFLEVRGAGTGPVQHSDIDPRPDGTLVLDLTPDLYTVDIEPLGFLRTRGKLRVEFDPIASLFEVLSPLTLLPKVSELDADQKRLLATLDTTKTPGGIWDALSDNKMATFFQVSHALTNTLMADGEPLSSLVDHIVRVGGSQLTATDPSGALRTVIGWRMHVVFETDVRTVLEGAGFKRDPGEAHSTHKRFGFGTSFRQKGANPRLQIVTDHDGRRADVDLDNGVFHRSSPQEIYKAFAKRYPEGAKVYKVT